MQTCDPIPDELTVRQTIAERQRELRLLRSIERALSRHRRDVDTANRLRNSAPTVAGRRGLPNG